MIVERYRLPLTRYCARMVGADNADDVVQDTLTASFTALGSDDRPTQLKPWLYKVAHNAAITALRKKGRQKQEELDENLNGVTQPHDQLEQTQRLHDLVANMRALPERQRMALVLQELEGLTPEEIADELDGSVPMVRQLVHRARERLRNGVGMLIPVPLILKLLRVDNASAATGKSAGAAAATTKPAGVTLAGVGATGTGAKVAAALAVVALAGGGVGVKRVLTSSESVKPASTTHAAGHAPLAASGQPRISSSRSAHDHAAGGSGTAPGADGATPSTGVGTGGDSSPSANSPRAGSDSGRADKPGAPGNPPTTTGGGSNYSQAPAAEAPSRSGGGSAGGSQPSGGESQPSGGGSQPSDGGGSQPSGGGGGTPPSGGGSTPSCKPVLGIPLPLICLGK
jgi:RNA polymerase sigma factor (sigma-70 family)